MVDPNSSEPGDVPSSESLGQSVLGGIGRPLFKGSLLNPTLWLPQKGPLLRGSHIPKGSP